jgi:alpha-tubulin suppressor-like RCC1 family protein
MKRFVDNNNKKKEKGFGLKTSRNVEILDKHANEMYDFYKGIFTRQVLRSSSLLLFLMYCGDFSLGVTTQFTLPPELQGVILSLVVELHIFVYFPQGFYQPIFYRYGPRRGEMVLLINGELHYPFYSFSSSSTEEDDDNNEKVNRDRNFNDFDFDKYHVTPSRYQQVNSYILSFSVGNKHCILNTKHGLYAFGSNKHGQLGIGPTANVNDFPMWKMETTIDNVVQVSCSYSSSTLVLTSTGCLYACGENKYGQLGLGDFVDRFTLELVKNEEEDGNNNIIAVSSGRYFTIILKNDGSLLSCGKNEYGVLGLGSFSGENSNDFYDDCITIPTFTRVYLDCLARPLLPIKSIRCGPKWTIAYHSPQYLYAFGDNEDHALGLDLSSGYSHQRPIRTAEEIPKVKNFSCGNQHSIFLSDKNELFGCGYNERGLPLTCPDSVFYADDVEIPDIEDSSFEDGDSRDQFNVDYYSNLLIRIDKNINREEETIVFAHCDIGCVVIHTTKRVIIYGKNVM